MRLTAKPLEVLVFLVEHHGRVVSKHELMETVWKDIFVGEDNVTQAVLKIRRVLGDEKDNPQFVQTIARVGYRFVGPVTAPAPPAEAAVATTSGRHTSWPKPAWWVAAGALLAAVASGALWLGGRQPAIEPARQQAQLQTPVPLPLRSISATKPAFEADGRHFLFVGYRKDQPGIGDIYRASLDTPDVVRMTYGLDPRGDHPVLTPDGSDVVFTRWRGGDDGTRWPDLWRAPTGGGDARVILEQASGAGFSPDGTWLAYTKHLPGSRALWIAPRADLTRHREIAQTGFTPRWSPDGKWIAYTTSNPEGGAGELWMSSVDLSIQRRLTAEPRQFHGIAWMPDSRQIIYAASGGEEFRLWKLSIDGGQTVAVTGGFGSSSSPSVAPDGQTLLFSHFLPARDLVYAPDVTQGRATELTRGEYHVWPVLSPTGDRVASVIRALGFGENLYITDVSTGNSTRASDGPARHPVWLDAGHVAYLGPESRDGTDVRVVDVSTGVNRTWCRLAGTVSWLAVHPDRQRIAVVVSAPNGRQSVVVRDLGAQSDIVLAEGGEYEHLRWIPRRHALSWSGPQKSTGPQTDGIWTREVAGSAVVHLVTDGYSPAWNDEGTSVYYSRIGSHSGLWRFDLGRLAPVRLQSWDEVDYFDVRNGRLVFARIGSQTRILRLPLS